jgi:hypothetical protein
VENRQTALLKLVASFCPVVRHRAFFLRDAVPRYVFKLIRECVAISNEISYQLDSLWFFYPLDSAPLAFGCLQPATKNNNEGC